MMSLGPRIGFFCSLLFLSSVAVSAQEAAPSPAHPGRLTQDVVVTSKSGVPVSGLGLKDFKLLDNNAPRPIVSFSERGKGVTPASPVEVVLVVDAVNIGFQTVAYERQEIDKFLKANEGRLSHPTALAIFTDTGTQMQQGFSTDGNALSASLDEYTVGLRSLRRSAGFYGATERFQLSLTALHQLAVREAMRPGRKIVLWVSPGWPLLSGPGVQLSGRQQQQLFSEIVGLSAELRKAQVTLYSIDPLGTSEPLLRTSYYQQFIKGINKPGQVDAGDLALQVLATQTGGLALHSNNDIAALLTRSNEETSAYYEITFDPPPAEHTDEYHHVEVQVAQPGLTARTREGYYGQP